MTQALAETWFDNVPMGQRTRFITLPFETAGRAFVREYITRPHMGKYAIPEHFHPTWTETFDILRGRARYRLGREEREAGPGEQVVLPPRVSHLHPWSASDEELHVRHIAVADPPDLRGLTASLQAILTIFALAGQGRVNRRAPDDCRSGYRSVWRARVQRRRPPQPAGDRHCGGRGHHAGRGGGVERRARAPHRVRFDSIAEVRKNNEDVAAMLEWFDRVGYDVDMAALEREFRIRSTGLAAWAAQQRGT